METFECKIDQFGYPELVAILLKLSDTGGNLQFWVQLIVARIILYLFNHSIIKKYQ